MKSIFTFSLLFITSIAFSQSIEEQIKNELVEDWKRAKTFTLEYIEAMPEEKINFRATDDIRSFAEQMLHLSQGTIGLVSNGTGSQKIYADVNLEQQEKYKSKNELIAVVSEAYDYAIQSVGEFDMDSASEIVKAGPFDVTRLGWIRKAFEHQNHHRGQCAIYLRLSGVTPPRARLF